MTPFVYGTGVAVCALLVAEWRQAPIAKALTKTLASCGFMGAAVAAGALESPHGIATLVALLLCLLGDVALLSRAKLAFLLGLLSFLLGHVGYAVAFFIRGVHWGWLLGGIIPVYTAGFMVAHWLQPFVDDALRAPVKVYIAAICAMTAASIGAWGGGATAGVMMGAILFFVSDMAVATDRFVSPGLGNRLWGLPLYYAGQLLLAATLAPPG
jgi:uncharacterized membrane protein YhhN